MIFNNGSVIHTLKMDCPGLYENTAQAPFPFGPQGVFVLRMNVGWPIFKRAKNVEVQKNLQS